ncbi:MAG: acyltransferase domain-containing protein, partial [Anaerolineae bacterium]|nr:acyltransferase domain-containing protein [Anaerolineae bacterium]
MTFSSSYAPIAIIGAGCRFPGGASTPDAYWRVLTSGEHTSTEVPPDRWDLKYYDPDPDIPGKYYSPYSCFIDQVRGFDAQFFEISPREAASLDPQQRLLLEVAWEAVENANLTPAQLAKRQTGVFVGISSFDYSQMMIDETEAEDTSAYSGTGNSHSTAAGRLSYFLKLTGPNLAVDTACSSSLVALHLAARSLHLGECDAALVGGVNLMLSPMLSIAFSKARMLAADGRCKAFDRAADGYVRSEGCGIVVLKRLADALADGDRILAVIRGSAVNHDGPSSGLTVPSQQAQERVIRDALHAAGLSPADIGYVEAHGTGTAVGDPIEAAALADVFGPDRSADNPLIIGSSKTSVGHMEAASGMAGLIKSLLALQHQEIPPHLHFEELNPLIDWDGLPFEINTAQQPWQPGKSRLVSINNFGFSGTNAHIVLEEFAPVDDEPAASVDVERPLHLLTLSAKSENALQTLAGAYADHIASTSHPLADIGYTANTSRAHFDERLALAAESAAEAAEKLAAYAAGERVRDIRSGHRGDKPRIAFLFSGQGAQYVGMGADLYQSAPRFRQTIDYCASLLVDFLDVPLLELLYPENAGPEAGQRINQTKYAQPAIFALQYALVDLWRSWGIEPDVVVGHSVGEYAAACAAGAISLEGCLRVLALRGPTLQNLPPNGGMLAVIARPETVDEIIAPYIGQVSIAAYNSPTNLVVSGLKDALIEIGAALEERGIQAQMLDVSHAFHSHLMDPALPMYERIFDNVEMQGPQIPMVSSVTGKLIGAELGEPIYWTTQSRLPVRFTDSIETIHAMGCDVLIEIGPQSSLLSMARSTIPADEARDIAFVPSLRQKKDNWQTIFDGLMTLYLRGADIDWQGFDAPYTRRKVSLPNYPFERTDYWFSDGEKAKKGGHHFTPTDHPLLGESLPVAGESVRIFQQKITTPGLFADHRIFDVPVMPATGYLELALAAGRETFRQEALVLSDVRFEQMLNLSDLPLLVQVVITRRTGEETASFEIFSRPDDDYTPWLRHASGQVVPLDEIEALPPVDFEAVAAGPAFAAQDVDLFYRRLNYQGLTYGPAFRGMDRLWRGDNAALGRVVLPPDQVEPAYVMHPALSDAALHPLAEAGDGLMLPAGVDRLAVWGDLPDRLWSKVESGADDSANLHLFNDTGEHCASIEGLRATTLDRGRLLRLLHGDIRRWAYKLAWKSIPPSGVDLDPQGVPWLIFGGEGGTGDELATWIAEQGGRCVVAVPGAGFEQSADGTYIIDPASREDFDQLLAVEESWQGVVYLWGEGYGELTDLDALWRSQQLICGGVLNLIQSMAGLSLPPRLCLVTCGAQSVGGEGGPQVAQSPLWGLGRVALLEHPELACVLVDLDPAGGVDNLPALLDTLAALPGENQIAYRDGQRYAARMTVYDQEPGQLIVPGESFQLKLSDYGIDNLYLSPVKRREPSAGEVEIQVQAAGLNFRDTLTALGMLQEATAAYGIHDAGDIPLGGECSGVVTAVGEGVGHLQVGDEVLTGFALGSLGSHVIARADLVYRRPEGMTPQEAATLPIAFLTAYYGLIRLANLQPGERVLIHSAAGGVGQAAVQLAKRVGAEIYATASPGKWDFLREQGIDHIMNSRTLDFGQQIVEATGGQGVDVALNSLTGDFIGASLDALGENGRFIEMGKIGILSDEEMQSRRPDVGYAVFDLLEMAESDPDSIRAMFDAVRGMIEAGEIEPLPHHPFPIHQAVDAFRFMAQAKHTGKVVITLQEAGDTRQELPLLTISHDAAYLITGG